jgi:hypothetical protein
MINALAHHDLLGTVQLPGTPLCSKTESNTYLSRMKLCTIAISLSMSTARRLHWTRSLVEDKRQKAFNTHSLTHSNRESRTDGPAM